MFFLTGYAKRRASGFQTVAENVAIGDGASLLIGAVESGNTTDEGSWSLVLHRAADHAVFDDTIVFHANATHIVVTGFSNDNSLHIRVDIEMANGAFGGDGLEEAGITSVGDAMAVTVEIAYECNLLIVPLVTQVEVVIETERSTLIGDVPH